MIPVFSITLKPITLTKFDGIIDKYLQDILISWIQMRYHEILV